MNLEVVPPPGSRNISRVGTWLGIGVVLALFCAPLFVGLGGLDLANDEAIYSFAVDRILEIGDWLIPKSSPDEDAAFLEKPPLKFWIVAAPIQVGLLPHDEFGLRFWDAVFGAAAFLYVFGIGRSIRGPVCGVLSVLILFVHGPLLFEHGLRSNNMEAPLVLGYSGGVYHYLKWTLSEPIGRRRLHVTAVAVYFVLGFMTKFVAALFLPVVLLTISLGVRAYRARLVRDWRLWAGGCLLALALSAPWFLYQQRQFGNDLWKTMLDEHVYRRFTDSLDPEHVKPWHQYFSESYAEFERSDSLILVLGGAAFLLVRVIRDRWAPGLMVLLWFALPLGLMSLGTSKLYHYAYPFLPAAAVAGGYLPAFLLSMSRARIQRVIDAVDRRIAVLSPTLTARMRRPGTQAVLLSIAVAAILISAATWIYGPVRFVIGDAVLLRNSSVVRPWLVALVAVAVAGRVGTARRVAVPVLILCLLPLSAYGMTMARLPVERHPMRSVRDCALRVAAQRGGERLGVYVHVFNERVLHHSHYYYFRRLGPREQPNEPSDARLYSRIFMPGSQRFTLISKSRFERFLARIRARDESMVASIARLGKEEGGPPIDVVTAGLPPAFVRVDNAVLVLPGEYGVCAPDSSGARVAR